MTKKRSLCVGWTRNADREVTEIQRTAEDVSCHYLYLRRTQPQPQTVFAQIQNTDVPAPFVFFFGSKNPPRLFLSNFYQLMVKSILVSFFVSFPIPSPNPGVLWVVLAVRGHLRESLSIIWHHQCSGRPALCNY